MGFVLTKRSLFGNKPNVNKKQKIAHDDRKTRDSAAVTNWHGRESQNFKGVKHGDEGEEMMNENEKVEESSITIISPCSIAGAQGCVSARVGTVEPMATAA